MNINSFLTGVTVNITSKTKNKSISPYNVGNTFTELANLTKENVDVIASGLTLLLPLTGGTLTNGLTGTTIQANSFVKSGGTSSQYLMADGSVSTDSGSITAGVIGNVPNSSGVTISGGTLILQPASLTNGGILTTLNQSIGGSKTFSSSNSYFQNPSGNTIVAIHRFTTGYTAGLTFGTLSPNSDDWTIGMPSSGIAAFMSVASNSFHITRGNAYFNIGLNGNVKTSGTFTSPAFIKSGGTSSEYLMADGSVSTGGGVSTEIIGNTPNASGLTLSSGILNLEPASSSFGGIMTTIDQTFVGVKRFSSTGTTTKIELNRLSSGSSSSIDFTTSGITYGDTGRTDFRLRNFSNSLFIENSFNNNGTIFSIDYNGTATITNKANTALVINNNGGTYGIDIKNNGGSNNPTNIQSNNYKKTQNARFINNGTGTTYNLLVENTGGASGDFLNARTNGVSKIILSDSGTLTALSFVKSGGTSSQYLMADGSVSSGSGGNMTGGTYTPTLTNVANITSTTAYKCQYTRVDNIVTVYGKMEIDATNGTSTVTTVEISLPISSNFTVATDLNGVCFGPVSTANPVSLIANTVNDTASFTYTTSTDIAYIYSFTFSYEVK